MMVYRKTGAPALDLFATGLVQSIPLTHYLSVGANPIATGFTVDAPIGLSGLLESDWTSDSNGSASPIEEDLLYSVAGSSFADEIFLHDGALAASGRYVTGNPDDAFGLGSSRGFVLFVQSPTGLRWRQTVPF